MAIMAPCHRNYRHRTITIITMVAEKESDVDMQLMPVPSSVGTASVDSVACGLKIKISSIGLTHPDLMLKL